MNAAAAVLAAALWLSFAGNAVLTLAAERMGTDAAVRADAPSPNDCAPAPVFRP